MTAHSIRPHERVVVKCIGIVRSSSEPFATFCKVLLEFVVNKILKAPAESKGVAAESHLVRSIVRSIAWDVRFIKELVHAQPGRGHGTTQPRRWIVVAPPGHNPREYDSGPPRTTPPSDPSWRGGKPVRTFDHAHLLSFIRFLRDFAGCRAQD